jgi:hypothetical protein
MVMRFRTEDFDVPMPDSLVRYWTAWNESDLDRLEDHLRHAVTPNVVWNDPRDSFQGIDALAANMRALKSSKPRYRFHIASEIDGHHHRLRYRWNMVSRQRTLMEGLDVVTLCATTGLIERVDGFFGEPSPVHAADSGIPAALQAPAADLNA